MKKKVIALCLVVALLAVSVIGGTLAYFTDTDDVQNTFAAGKVKLTLDEAETDLYGVVDGNARVDANRYIVIPGHEYFKDPTVHIEDGSVACYVIAVIDNQLGVAANDEQVILVDDEQLIAQAVANDWIKLDIVDQSGKALLAFYQVVPADKADAAVSLKPVFETVTVNKLATNEDVAAFDGKNINVTAYGIQQDGFDTAADAWYATFGAKHA